MRGEFSEKYGEANKYRLHFILFFFKVFRLTRVHELNFFNYLKHKCKLFRRLMKI